jgi:predicted amidohydrolase YtcJ/glyoxylase-like metal-dependent hydrolase (beta-lactamase superfamily II)
MHKTLRQTLFAVLCMAVLLAVIVPSALAKHKAPLVADTVYINGNIYTVDTHFNRVQAMAIKDGKFIAVGRNVKILKYLGKDTTVINLKGKTVLPGLWDSHLHVTSTAQALVRLDATGLQPADIVAKVAAAAAAAKPGDWIIGRGWNQVLWTDQSVLVGGMPTAAMLDAVSPNNPVYLTRVDGHGLWVNSQAMKLNNVDKNTLDVQGGKIYRYPDGTPTGAFADAANSLIKTPAMSEDQLKAAILLAQQKLFSMGNTSVGAMSVSKAEVERLRGLYADGSLKIRISDYVVVADAPNYYSIPASQRIGLFDDRYTINGIKLTSDGALGSRGAWLMAPYSDAVAAGLPATWVGYPTFGAPYYDASGNPVQVPTMPQVTDKLVAAMEPAVKAGFQVAIHAIGDAANHTYLDAVQRVEKDLPSLTKDPRFRDEHTQIVALSDLPRFAPLKVVPSMQAQHATSDMNMAEARVGYPRILGGYAWQTLIKSGVKIPDGSDSPVELANPFWGLYSAVTREDHNGQSPVGAHTPGGSHGWYAEQAMTREQALRSFTSWAAYGAFAEQNRGSIVKNKEADFVIVDRDYMTCPKADLWRMKAEMTVVGGEVVYTAPGFDTNQAMINWWDIQPRPEWKNLPIVKMPARDSWFEVHKLQPKLYAILEPSNWQEVISYLFIGKTKALLWDTGMDIGDMKQVVGDLTKLPVTVLNSHSHSDHMGGDYQFKDVWAFDDSSGFARANQAGVAHAKAIGSVGPGSMARETPGRFHLIDYYIHPYTVTHWVTDGEKIDLGNRVLEVVATPGHSPDGISLLDRANRILLVGDVFYNSDLYAHLKGSNLADYTATATRLAGLAGQVRYILPSHNVSMISSSWLVAMNNAFQAIKSKTATHYTDSGTTRVYDFGYFKIDCRLADVQ